MKKQKLNQNWYFWKDGYENEKRRINLPHDAMIEEERVPDLENGNASGFYPGGKYNYVKSIYGEEAYKGKIIIAEFEGVYMNSTVLLNEKVIGGWVYGYTNFYVDLTEHLRIGEENELRVIVDNSMTPNSRWYSGSGIYRDVNLYVGNREHIVPDGIRVTTLSVDPAVIRVETETTADEGTEIVCEVFLDGKKIAEGCGADFQTEITEAKLWDAKEPNLYILKARLMKQDAVIDESEIRFGIRSLAWDAEKGFQVNGNTVKLKGGCIHHDNGPLGACSVYKAEYRRVKKLKELGYNAIRYSHNPAGKLFLDICDEVGMYVLDETFDQWKLPQTTYDYAKYFDAEWKKDVEALVKKDYSHPSVIMYCVGNEITDTGLPHGAIICQAIAGTFKSLDATRPTTIANNVLLSVMAKKMAEQKAAETAMSEEEKKEAEEKTVGSQDVNNVLTLLPKIMASITAENQEELLKDVFRHVDIVGYNYGELWYEKTHEMVPGRVMLSSETFPCKIGSNWKRVKESPYLVGDFMWTAWDYLGEAGVGLPFYGSAQAPFSKDYPCLTAGCGSVDLTGYVESQGYYTSIVFGTYKKPYIGVRPVDHAGEAYTVGKWRLTDAVNSWSWPGQEGRIADIEVYSIGAEVELLQDGISLGRKSLKECRAFYQAEYRPGKLEAISYDANGNELGRESLITAGESEKLTILPEDTSLKADGEDIAYIHIQITDDQGIVKMLKDRKLMVTVDGAATLRALASGNPETTEKFSDSSYTSYHGRLLAIVQSNGEKGTIKVTASAEGVETQTVELMAY
ncbi:MAG: glycoside hydrolase family 2 TIM barrel-domain containing protein [Eubacteriales bacterium]|nr:glycoside hydrolase family 2 TIM barrel-domain containing protein [Eubacteriales bacterium]